MNLYSLSLQRGAHVTQAIHGNFSGGAAEEVLLAKGKVLELLRPDDYGSLHSICETEMFGIVRTIQPFRFYQSKLDYIVVGTDSGRVVILKFDKDINGFERVHCETFGKTGVRRLVPGQYLAVDPSGRGFMIASVEKTKLIYNVARDSSLSLVMNSPIEAPKANTLVFDLCALDEGDQNPVFAALEVNYGEADEDSTGRAAKETEKMLTLYELDLGLNNVKRKSFTPVMRSANLLIAVPGGENGPGGVLVCAEGVVTYRSLVHAEHRAVIPVRMDMAAGGRSPLIATFATHQQTDLFFFLLQTEQGDIFRINFDYDKASNVFNGFSISYFDTIAPTTAMCVIMTHACLFTAGEFSNNRFYHFESEMGILDADAVTSTSVGILADNGEPAQVVMKPPLFQPQPLKNLDLIDDIPSLAPATCFKVANLANTESPQLFVGTGRGARSALQVLRHGLKVNEFAESPLPGVPIALWTVGKQIENENKKMKVEGEAEMEEEEEEEEEEDTSTFDKYILVSFVNATLVLSTEGESIQELEGTNFITDKQTLCAFTLCDGSVVQVHKEGFVQVDIHGSKPVHKWTPDGKKLVECAAANERQVVIALTGGQLMYFEYGQNGLLGLQEQTELGMEVNCVDVGTVLPGRQRCNFLAIGGFDKTVRILSLDPNNCLAPLSMQGLDVVAESLCLVNQASAKGHARDRLMLNIGLNDGRLVRSHVDTTSGSILDTQPQLLGTRPVKCVRIGLGMIGDGGKELIGVLAMSSRPWLSYTYHGRHHVIPLSYEAIEGAAPFTSGQITNGLVAISRDSIRFLAVEGLGSTFNIQRFPLAYTPRQMIFHPSLPALVLLEGDHNTLPPYERESVRVAGGMAKVVPHTAPVVEEGEDEDGEQEEAAAQITEEQIGYPRPDTPGRWASLVRVFDPLNGTTMHSIHLAKNEMGVSMATVAFQDRGGESFLVVGTVVGLKWRPRRSLEGANIHVYRFLPNGQLSHLHTTAVDDVPLAMCASPDGLLFSAVGSKLVVYAMGKRSLLQKHVYRSFPSLIKFIESRGDRVFVGDQRESVFVLRYDPSDRSLTLIADDSVPRFITAATSIDYDTVAGGDKFGNMFVLRLPSGANIHGDITGGAGSRLLWEQGTGAGGGAPNKLHQICQFHVGEIVTAVNKCALTPGRSEALVFTTVTGGIGAMMPFASRADLDFFTHLELHMRQQRTELLGRDHLQFRSYFVPVKDVIDGDMCEEFMSLSMEKQLKIAEELSRTPGEVIKKLEVMRNMLM